MNNYNDLSEQELFTRYRKNNDRALCDVLIRNYIPLVQYTIGKVCTKIPLYANQSEIFSNGLSGLFDAITKYHPEKNVKFKNYAFIRIKGAIIDGLRKADWMPNAVRRKAGEIHKAQCYIAELFGRDATDEEIAQLLGVSIKAFYKIKWKIYNAHVITATDASYKDTDTTYGLLDRIEGPSSFHPDVCIEQKELKELIAEAIVHLPEKERKILQMYYYKDMTFKEIGTVFGISAARVGQINNSAKKRLKIYLTQKMNY